MNIKTQEFLSQIHDSKVTIQLHQNKKGADFESNSYVKLCTRLEELFYINGFMETNMEPDERFQSEIQPFLLDIISYVKVIS
jgi:hypothetical protein